MECSDIKMVVKHLFVKFNVTSRVLTRKTAPPPCSHVFQQTRTIFKLIQDIVRKNVLTKFHEDWTINVTSRVLTRFYYTLKPYKFHDDWTKNVTSRETATPPGSHVFQPTRTIFELVQDIIIKTVLTKFHEDWTINVTSRVLTRQTALPPGGHVFHPTETIFELVQDFIGTHVPTKFHANWTKNVTSRVLTRKTATPPGSHTHVLTKFHEDWTKNVNVDDARRTTLDARRTKGENNSSP
ncbi:hypothetical protein DPMN_077273 [Dreissena polymorpha]|uniref:Uncharacterized protein n=1 Tax=Dreissena polymorpha TaxID=45954 RepID=A0A9D3YK66_DREPO|nr:hypothetical protein DPMN_077273 [Dreissena polymorpha]